MALARTKGAGHHPPTNEKRVVLVALLQQLKSYVQTSADANVENGASIIASAGLAVRKTPDPGPSRVCRQAGEGLGNGGAGGCIGGPPRSAYEW